AAAAAAVVTAAAAAAACKPDLTQQRIVESMVDGLRGKQEVPADGNGTFVIIPGRGFKHPVVHRVFRWRHYKF
ncbi:MAG: hypothetical protein MJA83_17385, partial [Gammaproteobacteria bacterium]|nr:hypothetical protein [Gammaproteobacteria bacterium]